MKTRTTLSLAILAVAILCLGTIARADDKEEALKKRFEQRYPALRAAKDAGKVGETYAGTVEAVDPQYLSDSKIKTLIDEENSDRAELYQLIAQQSNATADIVAQRAGERNFSKAKPGDWLKDSSGKWSQKKG